MGKTKAGVGMRIELRAGSVVVEGCVNVVAKDSRPMHDRETGKRFVEQIVPGAFGRALKHNEVKLLLNHDSTRVLGGTETNLKLWEDSTGLRAYVEISDPEVLQKAREKKLRGWSFGFYERDASEEDMKNGMVRRYVEEMELLEVSVIDERKRPCYEGTGCEDWAEGWTMQAPELLETGNEQTRIMAVKKV